MGKLKQISLKILKLTVTLLFSMQLILEAPAYGAVQGNSKIMANKDIPILVYHRISNNIYGDRTIYISPDVFAEQMRYLYNNGYTPITFRDLEKVNKIKKPVMITFDDGFKDNYFNAYPILKKYGFKATIFLVSKAVNHHLYLSQGEINKMKDLIDFEGHTASHCCLTRVNTLTLDYELRQSKKELEALLGKNIFVLSYPYGVYDDRVIQSAKKYYQYAVTTDYGTFHAGVDNNYKVRRLLVNHDMKFSRFISILK